MSRAMRNRVTVPKIRAGPTTGETAAAHAQSPAVNLYRLARATCLAALTASVANAQPRVATDSIPGTLVTLDLVRVPAGRDVASFLIGRTELTWDAYDPFAFGPGSGGSRGSADAISRPSRPYGAPDYGFGHAGYPAISVTKEAADAYCRWLSEKTGRRYRLPTEAEWAHAAQLAAGTKPLRRQRRDALAWHRGNAAAKSHPSGRKAADALGLRDLFGNVAEWVTTSDGQLATRGGSWRDAPGNVGPAARALQDDSWNERDPQIPKSPWWLSDGPFVGFRIVREP